MSSRTSLFPAARAKFVNDFPFHSCLKLALSKGITSLPGDLANLSGLGLAVFLENLADMATEVGVCFCLLEKF